MNVLTDVWNELCEGDRAGSTNENEVAEVTRLQEVMVVCVAR